jgi:DNA-directed RNA polymerase specialized sigma24 family protein
MVGSEVQDVDRRPDERLWEAFVGGDDQALSILERRHRVDLFWYLLLSTGKQDAAARALRSVWTLLAGFRAPYEGFGSFRAWLYAVATQNAVPATHPDTFGLTDLIDDLKRGKQSTGRSRLFFEVIDMARAERQPFLLVTFAGLTVEEAARACNFTVERTWRCLEKAYASVAHVGRPEAASAQ